MSPAIVQVVQIARRRLATEVRAARAYVAAAQRELEHYSAERDAKAAQLAEYDEQLAAWGVEPLVLEVVD